MNYREQFVTKKATSDVAGSGANYRIEYIVRNPTDAAINSITATLSEVTTEGQGEQSKEKLVRVGNACVDMDNNRNYLAFEKHSQVTADNQATIAARYFADVKSILA